jgi:hypothetical protein
MTSIIFSFPAFAMQHPFVGVRCECPFSGWLILQERGAPQRRHANQPRAPLFERAGAPEAPELMLLVMMFGWAIRQLWATYQYR